LDLQSLNKFVINLAERADRREQVIKELEGWNYVFSPGYKKTNPMLGIAEAHINCVHNAQFLNLPYVMIMEDDVKLRNGCVEYFNEALNHAPEDWEILLGGIYESKRLEPVNEYWNKTGEFCGLHFYIVRNTAYDKILSYDGKQHIDRYMNFKGHGLKCYVTKKLVATQYSGLSNNTNKNEDYTDKLSKFKLL